MKQRTKKPRVMIIWDGFGIRPKYEGNAVELAKKPVYDGLRRDFLYTELGASGEDVGLEKSAMSGSEVGHANIGAGRIVKQESRLISESIEDGSFFKNSVLTGAMNHVKQYGSKLHLMGLLSNGDSPHSRKNHFAALLNMAKMNNISKVFVHFFSDGRDSKPKSARKCLKYWEEEMRKQGVGKVATIGGRYYGMDRAKNWDRLKKAYEAIVQGKGEKVATAGQAISAGYKKGLTDEFILPSVIYEAGKPVARFQDGDAVIFFNLRSDRARQFTKLFVQKTSRETELPEPRLNDLYFAAMTAFGPDLEVRTAYEGKKLLGTLPRVLGENKKKQLYISETEKFAHVTYFLNGGFPEAVGGEDRIMIPSKEIKSYDQVPEMSAKLVTDVIIKYLREDLYDFIFVNYPNPDMLGHTGNIKATIKGIEFIDKCLGRVWKEVEQKDGFLLLAADHGNAEEMIDLNDGSKLTFHTRNKVPFLTAAKEMKGKKLEAGGILGNIAPTILDAMGLERVKEMISGLFVKRVK
ncbi:MAG: 2,3-bisphosphoglycerate-independent phosphoglycerate mutase [Patescibacteria group bacterium]|nr:2,3-bisphosphoglycerate-independent phosphoglycerate mutase [Patescibacteria group bacterium]